MAFMSDKHIERMNRKFSLHQIEYWFEWECPTDCGNSVHSIIMNSEFKFQVGKEYLMKCDVCGHEEISVYEES
jgi:hypothetical protein|tara:strand:+ start:777 stop:995 length:219 start_codon:yes stop_codon:yes gene_type:complete